jgi:hypothetical protein
MSFFDLSVDVATRFHTWGWRLSVTGSIMTFLGVLLLMWGTRVRDQDFEEQVAVIHSRAAISEERAAGLEKEASQLRLDLQRERTSRSKEEFAQPATGRQITQAQRQCLISRLRDFKTPVILRFEPDQEAGEYAASLRDALTKAGVTISFGSAQKSGMTGTKLAMVTPPGGGEPLPAATEMASIMQYCGISLSPPIPWQQFPRSAGEAAGKSRPAEVLLFVGSKPAG